MMRQVSMCLYNVHKSYKLQALHFTRLHCRPPQANIFVTTPNTFVFASLSRIN